jgi:hypothetical protein
MIILEMSFEDTIKFRFRRIIMDFLAKPETAVKTAGNRFGDYRSSPMVVNPPESIPNSTNVLTKGIPDCRYLKTQPEYAPASTERKTFSRLPRHTHWHGGKRKVFGSSMLKFLTFITMWLFNHSTRHTKVEAKKPVPEIKLIGPPSTPEEQPADLLKFSRKMPINPEENRLPNPKAENYHIAIINLVHYHLGRWSIDKNPYSPEETDILQKIAQIMSDAWHISLPVDKAPTLTTVDFPTIVTVIRSLRKKVGLAELAVAILIALVIEHRLYAQQCRTLSEFFHLHGEVMGLSPSGIRDYYKRGVVFLKYRNDILEGVDEIPGIPLDEFVSRHMSKLTIYEKAVEKFGRKEALCKLRLTFREFQKLLSIKKPKDKKPLNPLPEKTLSTTSVSSQKIHEEQKEMILELNLAPNEKRLLRIIAKNGIVCTIQKLTEEQLSLLETRLHQCRLEIFQRNLKYIPIGAPSIFIDPINPLSISDELYSLTNIDEIILRIRAGLSLVAPARRTIAILVFRLYSEKFSFESLWKHPRKGVDYSSFRDFAMEELGMGEDYRDYIAVGRVLKDYYYFLDGLSEIDTEVVFLKLRYLPEALKTHKGNEPLVLARLRSLTVREFKIFSEEPDFEITFSKKLTKKQLDEFDKWLCRTRPFFPCNISIDFIEIYKKSECVLINKIEREVIEETESSVPLTLPSPVSSSGLTDEDNSH